MHDIQIVALKCKIKPQRPEECGYTTWERVKEAMAKQGARPLVERLRPCVPRNAWLYYSSCQKCENSLWDLAIDGVPACAVVRRILGNAVELYVPDRQETLEYFITKKEWRLNQTPQEEEA